MSGEISLLRLPVEDLDGVINAVGVRWEMLRKKRLLLTGGTGFIGKWMLATFLHANRILSLSAEIVVLSRRPEVFLKEFPELCSFTDVAWLNGDVRNLTQDTARDYNFVIHAATDVVAKSTPIEILDSCIGGTRSVLELMGRGTEKRRLLLLSSGAVYGRTPPEIPFIPETWHGAPDPLTPSSAYGEGKRISEMLCSITASTQPDFEFSIARCFAFVGPHLPFDKHFAIGNFIGAAIRGEDIRIEGDGTPLRSYLYAADLARWLWVLLFDAPTGRAYNVGGSEALSISQLAYRVNSVLGSKGAVHIAQKPRSDIPPQSYVPSLNRITSDLGLLPAISLDESILRTAHWGRNAMRK